MVLIKELTGRRLPLVEMKLLIFGMLLASCGPVASNDGLDTADPKAPGDTFSTCSTCPPFVRVPTPPRSLRPIAYVAQHPLTWNEYLVSVDEGVCPSPSRTEKIFDRVYKASDFIDDLRVDWPISVLTRSEINCFSDWLQQKTSLQARIPTQEEWEWFAAGDLVDAKFPWGNESDNPPASVPGVTIRLEDEFLTNAKVGFNRFLNGTRVEIFPPNSWGLYDLIGNQYELTSTTYTGLEWLERNPSSSIAKKLASYDVVMLKGGNRYMTSWEHGISGDHVHTRIFDDRFLTSVSVRFVLIQGQSK